MDIRSFGEDDIASVVRLRRLCFQHSAHSTDEALASHFKRLFFRSPWPHDSIRSLVLESSKQVIGFLGVFPRPFRFDGKPLWAAVMSQFMVDPNHRGTCAKALLRTFLAGDQDFSFADLATPVVRHLWHRLGGQTAKMQSLFWTAPIHTGRHLLHRATRIGMNRWRVRALRPIAAIAGPAMDDDPSLEHWHEQPLDAGDWAQLVAGLPECYRLRPVVSPESMRWVLDCIGTGLADDEHLVAMKLLDSGGQCGGWYAYVARAGGTAQCLQVGTVAAESAVVLKSAARSAARHGCFVLAGRVQPEHLESMATPPMFVERCGPYMLVQSNEISIARAVSKGAAWLTRLEGEYWMSF